MQASSIPALIPIPFANSGSKNTIPQASQISVTPGAASYTDGFPPLTRTPLVAGGVAPSGLDFNGILNAITNAILWNQAGGGYYYDSTFGPAISGYPVGAKLNASDNSGQWINQTDANTVAPESTTTSPTGWVPGYQYGVTAITGLAATSVTLTPLQAAKRRITLAGTLTANINVIFPAWTKDWTIVNNCTGAFTVTCKTASGNGVTIAPGKTAQIVCDGTNITTDAMQSVLQVSNNLSDLASIPTALGNLRLGGFCADTSTTANSVVIASPVTLADGVPFLVKFANANTGAATITIGSNAAVPLLGVAGALQGGELAAGGYGWVAYSSTLASAVLLSQVTGASLQVNAAAKPEHAISLTQLQQNPVYLGLPVQSSANVYTISTALPLVALTTGMELLVYFSSANINTGAATLNINGVGASQIYGAVGALQGGELSGFVRLVFNLSAGVFRILSGGGALQISQATKSEQAVRLDQFTSVSNGNGVAVTLPNGAQYDRGNLTVPANGSATWTFPLAFVSAPQVFYTTLTPANAITYAMWINGVGTTSVTIYNPNSYACTLNMLAIL
jgi:hypothetical protein